MQDPKNENWSIVIKTRPRDLFDMDVQTIGEDVSNGFVPLDDETLQLRV